VRNRNGRMQRGGKDRCAGKAGGCVEKQVDIHKEQEDAYKERAVAKAEERLVTEMEEQADPADPPEKASITPYAASESISAEDVHPGKVMWPGKNREWERGVTNPQWAVGESKAGVLLWRIG